MIPVVLFRMFHILTAIWFVSGLIARGFALRQAAQTSDVRTVAALVQLAGRFERLMVIPGNAAVLLFGFVTAWLQGQPVFGVLQGASSNWLLVSVLLAASMVPVIPLVFIPRGKRFGAALEGALTRGQVTPELTAAFHDRAVARAHVYELVVVGSILILMITKPF